MSGQERLVRDIEALAKFTSTPGNGVTRLSFTAEEAKAREYIKKRMAEANLVIREHPSGNIIGRLEGSEASAAPVMSGSHFDTVIHGGAYDGVCGVVAAIEAVRSMRESGFVPYRPIEVIAFVEEEGARFHSGLMGSAAMLGMTDADKLGSIADDDGVTAAEAMEKAGFDVHKLASSVFGPGSLAAFVELHIEQGPEMAGAKADIGVVECINSMNFGLMTVTGRADHAGTTPMGKRADALRAAVTFISRFYAMAEECERTTATVGKLDVYPGSANVVPGKAAFTLDFRSIDMECVNKMRSLIYKVMNELSTSEVKFEYKTLSSAPAMRLDTKIQHLIEAEAERRGYTHMRLPSGAGHDAMNMAAICPAGMIFIPSLNGSHNPNEFVAPEALFKGAKVLEGILKRLSREK